MKLAFRRHPMNFIVKVAIILFLLAYAFHAGHVQGTAHAIKTAQVWSEDGVYLIAFDGEVHEYR